MRVFILLPMLLLLPSHPTCQAQQSSMADATTQTKKTIGPFDISNGLSVVQRETLLVRIRAFLWDNVSQHQEAEVKAKVYTLEGDPTEWTFSVVATGGRRCIRGDYVSTTYFGLKPGQKPKITKGTENYCNVVRVDVRTNLVVPEKELRTPDSYRLRLDPAHAREL